MVVGSWVRVSKLSSMMVSPFNIKEVYWYRRLIGIIYFICILSKQIHICQVKYVTSWHAVIVLSIASILVVLFAPVSNAFSPVKGADLGYSIGRSPNCLRRVNSFLNYDSAFWPLVRTHACIHSILCARLLLRLRESYQQSNTISSRGMAMTWAEPSGQQGHDAVAYAGKRDRIYLHERNIGNL